MVAGIFIPKSNYMNQKKHVLNNSLGLFALVILFVFILSGCEKKVATAPNAKLFEISPKSKFAQLPIIETIENVNKEDALVSQFKILENQDFGNYSYVNAGYQKIKFKNQKNLEGILITLTNSSQQNNKREIFFVIDKINNSYLSILREKNTNFNKDTLELKLKNLNGSLLFSDQFLKGKLIKNTSLLLTNNDLAYSNTFRIKAANVVWNCNREKFNEFYQQAKLSCEEDFFCDVLCSLEPCFIAYLAYAVNKCTESTKALN